MGLGLKNLISKMSHKKKILAALGLLVGTAGITVGSCNTAQAVGKNGFNGRSFNDMYERLAKDRDRQGIKFTRTSSETVSFISEAGLKDHGKDRGRWVKNLIDEGLMYEFNDKRKDDFNKDVVSVFYANYGVYTDHNGKKHHIGVMQQVSRNNGKTLGVIFSPKKLGVSVCLNSENYSWIGSINTRLVFYETKNDKGSTNFNDYEKYKGFKAPIYIRDIDVGQWFKLNGADTRNKTAVYTHDINASTDRNNDKIMDVFSSRGHAPRVAYSDGYYYGAGRSNSHENSNSVDSNDPRGQLGLLLTEDTATLSGTFGITNGKTYAPGKGKDEYAYEYRHHKKTGTRLEKANGVRYSAKLGRTVPMLEYYKNMPGHTDYTDHDFDDHQGHLSGSFTTKVEDKINRCRETIIFEGNYLGFQLGDKNSPDPRTTIGKQVQTPASNGYKPAASDSEAVTANVNDHFTYRLVVDTGNRGTLENYQPKYTKLTTIDDMYGVKLTASAKDAIRITNENGRNVTDLFHVKADTDDYRTRVEISLLPNHQTNSDIYDTKLTATVDVKADKKMLANCYIHGKAHPHDATAKLVKLHKDWHKYSISKTYTVQNQSKIEYEWDKFSQPYWVESNVTHAKIHLDEPRVPKTAISVEKQVYANGDYNVNIDKNVNKAANIIYNSNDRITYKITARFKADLAYDTDSEDGERENRYFSDFKLTDTIKDMQDLKVEDRLAGDNRDVKDINANIRDNKLTFTGTFSNRNDEHTVTIYVTGRPIVTNELKNIRNTAHIDYDTKADNKETYHNSFTKDEGARTDSNETWYQAQRLAPPKINKTAKEVTSDGNQTDATATTATFNKMIDYQITASSDRIGGTKNGQIHIADNDLDSRYQILSVTVMNQTTNTRVAYYKASDSSNSYSHDGLTVNGNRVEYVGAAYADKGTQYLMTIRVKYVGHQVITQSNVKTTNTADGWQTSEHENPDKTHATYTVNVIPDESTIVKYVKSIDDGSSTQVMNANSTHTVRYAYDMKIGNMHEMKDFKITDVIPKNMSLLPGLKLTVTYQDGYDGQQSASDLNQDDWKISYQDRKLELDLIKNESKYTYATVHIEYQASVADHADWSDYAARSANNETEVTDGKGALLPNRIMVPNTVYAHFNDGHNSNSTAYVSEQRKELEVNQTITQDNTNYTTSQDKSHYLPKTRSDRTAVTTRLEIQMPNYLKISDFSASSTPDKAKMDRGNTHYERFKTVNSDNPDLTNSSLGLPSDMQEMSGKQYYYYTKYSPKTKYYENYAKLDKMWDKFNGQVIIKSNKGTTTQHANDVKIHLPNIYSYKDITSVITYPNDKTAKIVVHGQVTGLAVDSDNPTNFASERKAYDEANTVTGQIRSSGGYVSTWSQIDLPNDLKTGQTGLTKQTYTNIDVSNLTGGSSSFDQIRSYKSASTLTERLGHSVVLTSDKVSDDYKIGNNKYKSLTDTIIGTDPMHILITGQEDKDVFGDDTDNRNQALIDIRKTVTSGYIVPKDQELNTPGVEKTIPHKHVTYYDIDKDKSYVRNYEEGYMFVGPDEVSAKAGYGLQDTHTLYTWTYDNDTDYNVNVKSADGIFSSTYIQDANNAKLDYDKTTLSPSDYAKVFNAAGIKADSKDGYDSKTTFDKDNASYNKVIGLENASDSDKALIAKNEAIVNTVPTYHLRRFDFKYAHRHLRQGIQTLKDSGTDGGYANYIRDYDANKDTKLTYRSENFGTLSKIKMNTNEILHIYGHRSLTKHGTAIGNIRDELILHGSLSGHTAANTNSDLNKFLKTNTDK